ncbi:hypothetical protein R9C00_14195 [Flammeovirgaceae bacterium SG7u.111]|nr:hypothetical protein [Flammeovirgaceae bacterium SG7u.132]WPO38607.1 hypothetical protein R9C00_14195 [Flammeovirgaceae bacterium SG7u.111]
MNNVFRYCLRPLAFFILFSACSPAEKAKHEADEREQLADTANKVAPIAKTTPAPVVETKKSPHVEQFVRSLVLQSLPYTDSTNFDNSTEGPFLSDELFTDLSLQKILPYEMNTLREIWIRNRLELSADFHTVVVSFMPSEHELFTTLVSYNKDMELIDFLHIAYDEIAESCARSSSYIEGNMIDVYNINFCRDEASVSDTTTYTLIPSSGEFVGSE